MRRQQQLARRMENEGRHGTGGMPATDRHETDKIIIISAGQAQQQQQKHTWQQAMTADRRLAAQQHSVIY